MDWSVCLSKRINYESCLDIEQYVIGMKLILESFINDLEKFLDKEGRYFGITVHYLHSMRESLKKIEYNPEENFGDEILYLYRPVLLKAYKKYVKRGLSRADSIICLTRSVCGVLLKMYNFEPLLEIYDVFDKLYMNIKNTNKEFVYVPLVESIEECMMEGKVGLYKSDAFSVINEEKKRRIKDPINGSGVRINKSDNEVSEVSWVEE